MNKNLKAIPQARLEKLNEKQRRTIESYSSLVKLKSVLRWKPRMAAAGVTLKQVAEACGKVPFRISEWINFTHEPGDENFDEVESAIHSLEGTK